MRADCDPPAHHAPPASEPCTHRGHERANPPFALQLRDQAHCEAAGLVAVLRALPTLAFASMLAALILRPAPTAFRDVCDAALAYAFARLTSCMADRLSRDDALHLSSCRRWTARLATATTLMVLLPTRCCHVAAAIALAVALTVVLLPQSWLWHPKRVGRAVMQRPARHSWPLLKRPARRRSWHATFARLQHWCAQHPDRWPSQSSAGFEYRLARWMNDQRVANAAGTLPTEKQTLLNSLPGWKWRAHGWAASADDMYERLSVWLDEHAGVWPKRGAADAEECRLARWIDNQRQKRATLSADHAADLEALDGWEWNARDATWDAHFVALQDWYTASPTFDPLQNPPTLDSTPEDRTQERALALWVNEQRRLHTRAQLSAQRASRLDALPQWRWSTRARGAQQQQQKHWEKMFVALKKWPSHPDYERGHEIPWTTKRSTGHEKWLGAWVEKQLMQFRRAQAPRRRLKGKTKPPQRMPAERVTRMQAFLHGEGKWLAAAFHARLKSTLSTLPANSADTRSPAGFEPPNAYASDAPASPTAPPADSSEAPAVPPATAGPTRQLAQEPPTRAREAQEPPDPRTPASQTAPPTMASARPALASPPLALPTAPTVPANAAPLPPMGMLRFAENAPALHVAAQSASPVALQPRTRRPLQCAFCGGAHSSSSCMLNPNPQ